MFIYKLCKKVKRLFVPYVSYEKLLEQKKREDYEFLISHGVETEYGYVTLLGKPQIYKCKGSRIVLGKNITLVSETKYNHAGIKHPVIIATETSNAEIIIGEGSGFSGTTIVAHDKIIIGKNFGGGANTCIYDSDFHPVNANDRLNQKSTSEAPHSPVIIGDNVWLASESRVLKGVTIGDNSTIASMSLVCKDVLPDSLYGGNPAKFIKKI